MTEQSDSGATVPAAADAAPQPPTPDDAAEAPDVGEQSVPDPGDSATTPTAEPDALGHVVEQEPVPEEQSTVGRPGEALDELLPALASTGHDGVDDALATLDDMAETSVHDHVEVFDAVHEELRRTLDRAADQ